MQSGTKSRVFEVRNAKSHYSSCCMQLFISIKGFTDLIEENWLFYELKNTYII